VCQAVDSAQRRHLVHRDLKPDNIFLTQDEVPKVLDFGIATFVQPAGTLPVTACGVAIGTRGYMSPEQLRGDTPHPSWDIWALAVITYEMFTGRLPFGAGWSPASSPAAAAGDGLHLTACQPNIQADINAMFAAAFSPDPATRPASALLFLHHLELILGEAL
jgi:serine/threonine protein kinase